MVKEGDIGDIYNIVNNFGKEYRIVWILGKRQVDPGFYLRKPKYGIGDLWCPLLSCALKSGGRLSMATAAVLSVSGIQNPSIFFLNHPEQETSIFEVTCSHKMAVAALAIASSSPGRKKESMGKGQ